MKHFDFRWMSLPLLVSWIAAGEASDASAAKLIRAIIQRNEEIVFEASFTTSDNAWGVFLWAALEHADFQLVGDLSKEEARKERIRLKGRIKVYLFWGNRTLHETRSLDQLVLISSPDKQEHWRLPEDEVDRTAKFAGYNMPPRRRVSKLVLGIAGALVAVILFLWFLYLRSSAKPRPIG